MEMLKRLWADDAGFIVSTELVFIATIVVLSMVVGLKKISSQVLAEMSDIANAIGYLNQGYSFAGAIFLTGDGALLASWAGTCFLQDTQDVGNGDWTSIDVNATCATEL